VLPFIDKTAQVPSECEVYRYGTRMAELISKTIAPANCDEETLVFLEILPLFLLYKSPHNPMQAWGSCIVSFLQGAH